MCWKVNFIDSRKKKQPGIGRSPPKDVSVDAEIGMKGEIFGISGLRDRMQQPVLLVRKRLKMAANEGIKYSGPGSWYFSF
jgi:hypothetical protein